MDQKNVRKNNYSYEDNMKLIQMARNGEPGALDVLVEMNLPLVSSISKKFLNRGYEYDDIFQIGCIGLVKAINNFDTKYNVKFSTYAVPMIMGEIKRFLRDDGIIKVSRSVKNTARQLHYDKDTLTKQLGRDPTIDELSAFCNIEKEDIVYALESASNMLYLFDTIHQDDGAPVLLIDKLSEKYDEDNQVLDKISLKEALRKLDAKSRQIIMLRYFKDNTQIQVAKMMGISQVQVSRIEKKVLKIMKEKLI
ncbi:RNA polymerase sporulation sigma factor SigF [Clostridium psychrophilum]|uniref:RNA polymerase sporulation sigma factor SigF n=1 Tax=Clostridium psychrophilum TaxID=132926 RepID=UPI001C0CFC04|nr:RNA polymerase sporulation sigma factor SigF [Clostridium psychrophilum]MBU3180026.1 RNA polymerase sporulation sigma factor SigF [Clostridium psychrophilum]